MINHGARPTELDARDYSFRKTFGAVPPAVFPAEFQLDAGFGFPNQNLPNQYGGLVTAALPYGCTEYTANELCSDQDQRLYDPEFTESKVHANETGGSDMRTPLKSVCNDGVQAVGDSEAEIYSHRRNGYFRVGQNPDYFDGMRTAILTNNRSVSIGTPWYLSWAVPINGIIQTRTDYDPTGCSWHCWKISGWKTINGEPYLTGKTWQGEGYGDGGWVYFSRQIINSVMKVQGTAAFTVAKATSAQIKTVGTTYLFLNNLRYKQEDIEVAELQKALISLGYSIVHATTTYFGNETKEALAHFQKERGVIDDGSHFGPQTRYQMNILLNPNQTLFGTFVLFARTYLSI